jgi:phosphoribosyl-AMP cyclohydrolase
MPSIETTLSLSLDFKKLQNLSSDIIPVVIQDAETKEVLILAYTNQLAFEKTISSKTVTLWSVSRNELWIKGKTSGQYLTLIEAKVNCEQNSLLYLVKPQDQGACHTKDSKGFFRKSCFYRSITSDFRLSLPPSF